MLLPKSWRWKNFHFLSLTQCMWIPFSFHVSPLAWRWHWCFHVSSFLTRLWMRYFFLSLTVKTCSRNSKLGYVSRKEKCQSHWEEGMPRCLLKSPSCAPKDNSCYQDGTSDGAYYEIGGTRTCDKGSWEESHMSQPLSLPQGKGSWAGSGSQYPAWKIAKHINHLFDLT